MINLFKTLLCSSNIDWTATGTMIIAVGTFILALIAWTQLKEANKISTADFDQRFKNDFFNEKTRQLFMLFQYDLMVFKRESVSNTNDEFPYFEVDRTHFDANPIFANTFPEIKYRYSAYEIDELLLGHFEDLGLFCKKGLMDIEFIDEGFGYYIEEMYKNEQIQNYISWTREIEDEGEYIFDKFDYIFNEVKRYGKRKKLRSKIKSFICRQKKQTTSH
jgi:hypothetical protein